MGKPDWPSVHLQWHTHAHTLKAATPSPFLSGKLHIDIESNNHKYVLILCPMLSCLSFSPGIIEGQSIKMLKWEVKGQPVAFCNSECVYCIWRYFTLNPERLKRDHTCTTHHSGYNYKHTNCTDCVNGYSSSALIRVRVFSSGKLLVFPLLRSGAAFSSWC